MSHAKSLRRARDLNGSFIRTPLLYPSGSTVVVQVAQGEGRFFVSDFGLGYQESDLYGAGAFYVRHARPIAENAGVGFDNQASSSWRRHANNSPGPS